MLWLMKEESELQKDASSPWIQYKLISGFFFSFASAQPLVYLYVRLVKLIVIRGPIRYKVYIKYDVIRRYECLLWNSVAYWAWPHLMEIIIWLLYTGDFWIIQFSFLDHASRTRSTPQQTHHKCSTISPCQLRSSSVQVKCPTITILLK